ncbi:unnamed protein product [Periconia digitata]|uniref:Uncharacterized protein n=1 Tax=Periconia digitata TaxID=1303443 RepID=A0A9W4UFF9_9PLEO|nr:unnamed protein product [Periconia digitata]
MASPYSSTYAHGRPYFYLGTRTCTSTTVDVHFTPHHTTTHHLPTAYHAHAHCRIPSRPLSPFYSSCISPSFSLAFGQTRCAHRSYLCVCVCVCVCAAQRAEQNK